MAREFRLPDIGEGLAEAEVIRWLVPVGEKVAVDQPIVEVETDKAVVEIPCPFAGVVLHHGAGEGETIEVGEVLVVVGEEGESWGAPEPADAAPIVGTIGETAEDLDAPAGRAPGAGARHPKVQALPVVRKLARDLGVDIEQIQGSGPHGRVTREDVKAAAERGEPAAEEPPRTAGVRAEAGRRPMSKLRRTIAANMARSWADIPHVTTFDDVEATRLLAAKRALEDRHGTAVSIDALVVKAVIPVLERFPDFEASLDGDDLVIPARHDIGVAVDTPDGLLVAVVEDAGRFGLLDLSAEIAGLAEKARRRALAPGQLSGQCFTVSNIGAVGGGHGTPIVPHGTTAILSVGRARERPIARDGRVEVAPLMPLSLSYDHRVIDGAQGRRFMDMVMENLSEPALFLAA